MERVSPVVGDGCNKEINYLKEHLKIGAPIVLRSLRTASFGDKYYVHIPKEFKILKKYEHFVECGVQLENGLIIKECFLYHDILQQHGRPSSLAPFISQ